MIITMDTMPDRIRPTKIRSYAEELQGFIDGGKPYGEYVVDDITERPVIYQSLKNAAVKFGLTDRIEVFQKDGAIVIHRKDMNAEE